MCPLKFDGSVSSIDFAPCGNKLAAVFNTYQGLSFKEGGVKIFSNQGSAGFVCQSTLNVGSWVRSVRFSPSGDTVAAGCNNGTVQITDVATAEVKRPLNVGSDVHGVHSVPSSPNGDMVAAGCSNGKIFFVDPTGGEIKSSPNDGGGVNSVHFNGRASTLPA